MSHGTPELLELPRATWTRLFDDRSIEEKRALLPQLGSLAPTFERFLDREEATRPLPRQLLIAAFEHCSTETDPARLLETLELLAPGGGRVGYREVVALTDHLRDRVHRSLTERGITLDLPPHDHAFGSGGDFCKTAHATTWACLLAAPRRRICKSGTTNVTSAHGSAHAIGALGYREPPIEGHQLSDELRQHGFAYLSLATLGFPYSDALRAARLSLWQQADRQIRRRAETMIWSQAVAGPIPLDIFKVVSPNARILDPRVHSTGICHLDMLPYVLAIYASSGATGSISHHTAGIDELAPVGDERDNLLLEVRPEGLLLARFGAAHIGLPSTTLAAIREAAEIEPEVQRFRAVVAGEERGPLRSFLSLNAATLLATGRPGPLLPRVRRGLAEVADLIDSGAVARNLEQLRAA